MAKAISSKLAKNAKEILDPSHQVLFDERFYCTERNELLKEFLINSIEGDILLLTTKSLIKRLKDHIDIKSSFLLHLNGYTWSE